MQLSSKMADFFSALGDQTRIRILGLVFNETLTVNEIKAQLGDVTLQALSYQLKKLEEQHLIRHKKDPEDHRKKYYQISDDHVKHILNDTIIHIQGGAECEGMLDCEDSQNLTLLTVTK